MALEGIDVSQFQGSIDWGAVAAAGVTFALAKVSEGSGFEDPEWATNAGPLAATSPITAGAYHFARPDLGNTPEDEADWFWQRLTTHVNPSGWLLALDLEAGTGDLSGWRDRFCARLSSHAGGYVPGWYTFWDFAQSHGLDAATPYWGWLAWPAGNGPLPAAAFSIDMQQYGTRPVAGISGAVDADRFFGDAGQLAALTVGGQMTLDPNDPTVTSIQSKLNDIYVRVDSLYSGSVSVAPTVAALLARLDALKTELDAVRTAVAALSGGGPVDLSKVYAELANLGKHLGVDVTTGAPS
jgi:lysozyme